MNNSNKYVGVYINVYSVKKLFNALFFLFLLRIYCLQSFMVKNSESGAREPE